jgi:hypothetical protein
VFLATNRRNMGRQPDFGDSRARVTELVEAEVNRWAGLWHAAHESPCDLFSYREGAELALSPGHRSRAG